RWDLPPRRRRGAHARSRSEPRELRLLRLLLRPRRQRVDAPGDHHPPPGPMTGLVNEPLGAIDVETVAELLHETADHHDAFEKATPPHNWWDWYAPYLLARLRGHTSGEATWSADLHMQGRGIVRGAVEGSEDADQGA